MFYQQYNTIQSRLKINEVTF